MGVSGQLYAQPLCLQVTHVGTKWIGVWVGGRAGVDIFREKYRVIQKDGLNFVRLYFLNYTWYVNDLHNIWKRRS